MRQAAALEAAKYGRVAVNQKWRLPDCDAGPMSQDGGGGDAAAACELAGFAASSSSICSQPAYDSLELDDGPNLFVQAPK
jgi:hypothetical protein